MITTKEVEPANRDLVQQMRAEISAMKEVCDEIVMQLDSKDQLTEIIGVCVSGRVFAANVLGGVMCSLQYQGHIKKEKK